MTRSGRHSPLGKLVNRPMPGVSCGIPLRPPVRPHLGIGKASVLTCAPFAASQEEGQGDGVQC
jgi:hypothetical protein